MKWLRRLTFAAALLVSLGITFWPPLLYGEEAAPGHGTTIAIILGLCTGVVYGCGILRRMSHPLQLTLAVAAWLAITTVAVITSR
ncbi:cyd operon YbgE family protein [Microbulbifer hainanensis]|uniref:cyd operon YbgE family protein n=1 Tax=Microbulbifer hainanensis TaxID=2735675 RepID=UPI001866DB78|nr:cyd operon YbgE family protein [Microbulbifer hainanensis]